MTESPPTAESASTDEDEYVSPCAYAEPAEPSDPEPFDMRCESVERRQGTEPERSAAVGRLLRTARTAQREERFDEAIAAFERAKRAAPNDAGVLGELGWARFRAGLACDEATDEYEEDAEDCSPMVTQAENELTEAAAAAVTDERRGMLHYNLGRIALHRWQFDEAKEAFRVSECLRPNETVRKALADVWALEASRAWESAEGATAVDALQIVGQLDASRREAADRALAAWRGGLDLRRVAPPRQVELVETLDEVCEGESCELVGDWVEHEGWALAHVRIDDGAVSARHVLVARTARGLAVVEELGSELFDDRSGNAYVREAFIEPVEDAPFSVMSATFSWGTASAEGCNWLTEAWVTMILCSPHEGTAHCFASMRLGAEVFESDSMLPTVQESLGRCPEFSTPPIHDVDVTPSFSVSFTPEEMVVEREHDGRTWCSPLREALCAGEHPPAACSLDGDTPTTAL